jgi:hypothetical protein
MMLDKLLQERIDERGPDPLVQLREPVNKFPNFPTYAIQRLKSFCLTMGNVKIAQTLVRAGLHSGSTTVGRMFRECAPPKPSGEVGSFGGETIAGHSNHTYLFDKTVVPTGLGFWVPWLPNLLTHQFPFC